MQSFARNCLAAAFLAAGAFLPFKAAQAAVVYTYTGNPFTIVDDSTLIDGTYLTDGSHFVSGSFVVDDPLAPSLIGALVVPTYFSFSDGRNTISKSDPGIFSEFKISTNSAGQIEFWEITLISPDDTGATPPPGTLIKGIVTILDAVAPDTLFEAGSIDLCTVDGCDQISDVGLVREAGAWSASVAPVPVPAALPLFASGLGVLGVFAMRRRKKAAA